MPAVKVRPGATDEYVIPFTVGWERQQEVGKTRRLLIDVERSEVENANLNPKTDAVELVGEDTVRLVDVQTGGPTWTLVCYSAEWDANRAGFTDGGNLRTGSDADLVNGLINEVGGWTAGTVTQQATGLSFVFNHANRAEAIRRIEKNVPGEIQFRNLGTVDYVDRLGSDRTANVELSSAAGTIEQSIQITERGRELDGTHIRVLGAHEGEAQLFANLVPSSDSGTYANRVNYTTNRWSDGDAKDWDRYVNKDVTDQATIEEEAANLGAELKETLVEAETTVPRSVGLTIGDTVQVVKDDANLNRSMRVHRLTRQAGGRNDAGDAAVVDKVLLSTRTILRTDDDDDLRDIQRFNSGFQGNSVVIQGGGARQPVDATNNAEIPFDYPNIVFENEATLHVRGLSYRAYSQGAGAGGDHSHSVSVTHPSHAHDVTHPSHSHNVTHPSHSHDISTTSADNADFQTVVDAGSGLNTFNGTVGTSWSTIDSFSVTSNVSVVFTEIYIDWNDNNVEFRLRNQSTGEVYRSDGIVYGTGASPKNFTAGAPENVNGDTLAWEARNQQQDFSGVYINYYQGWGQHTHGVSDTSTTALGTTETSTTALGTTDSSTTELGTTVSETSDASGTHTHPVDPGIIETADTPSGVDVLVNGSTVATNIGSGTFETQVDLSGALTQNAWNLVELTSDSLGHIQGTLSVRGYEQIGSQ